MPHSSICTLIENLLHKSYHQLLTQASFDETDEELRLRLLKELYVLIFKFLIGFILLKEEGKIIHLEETNKQERIRVYLQKIDRYIPCLSALDGELTFSLLTKNNLLRFLYDFIFSKLFQFDEIKFHSQIYLGNIYEKFVKRETRKDSGLFYTPTEIVEYMLDEIDYTEHSPIENMKVIDLSCGTGNFLLQAIKRLIAHLKQRDKTDDEIIETVLNNIYGLDIDPFACFLTKCNILLFLLPYTTPAKVKNFQYNIFTTNVIDLNREEDNLTIYNIKNRKAQFKKGFDFVIGNPPYIEAKRMTNKTKKLCRANFPLVAKGSFDIYVCFIKLGMDLMSEGGKVAYIIPNKFLATKFGKHIRTTILNKKRLKKIVDVSFLPVFKDAMVYPVILILDNIKKDHKQYTIELIPEIRDIGQLRNAETIRIPSKLYSLTKDKIYFFLPRTDLEREIIFSMIESMRWKLSELLTIRWSISFHKRGIRKEFVSKHPMGTNPQKFLGGKKWGGNSEVQRYFTTWNGYYIDYDRKRAKAIGNTFPPLSLFKKKKIVICQNAKRLRASIDTSGYVCKDIFLIGLLKPKAIEHNLNEEILLALLNSKLYSYFYAHVFSASHVAGRYLHYLTMYLNDIPIPLIKRDRKEELERKVKKILQEPSETEKYTNIDREIDEIVYNLFNLNNKQKQIVEDYVEQYMELKSKTGKKKRI